MKRLLLITIVAVVLPFGSLPAGECMDCGEKRTKEYDAEGTQIYPETSDAMCCMFPCWSGYTVIDEDVGYGCLTKPVENEIVVGTICLSSNVDKGCPSGGSDPGDDDSEDGDGGTGCQRDESGACPAWCASCD